MKRRSIVLCGVHSKGNGGVLVGVEGEVNREEFIDRTSGMRVWLEISEWNSSNMVAATEEECLSRDPCVS